MSDADKTRWNARYGAGEYAERTHPTVLLSTWLPQLPTGRALDIACGAGRNALFLSSCGFQVDAVDISEVALARAQQSAKAQSLDIDWLALDLDTQPLPGGPYDVVVVSRFLMHHLFPQIMDRLAPEGVLVYEQHLRTDGLEHAAKDLEIGGPRSARFRLRSQELLHLCGELQVMHYFEGVVQDPGGSHMALAQLVGRVR